MVVEKKVLIILMSYNKLDFVIQVIESVLYQIYSNWELFVMDDYLNEEILVVISLYIKDYCIYYYNSFIKLVDWLKLIWYVVLINNVFLQVLGEYIIYLIDDIVFYLDRFSFMVEVFN